MIKQKHVRIAIAIMMAVNLLILLWSVLGYGIHYETDDDASMAAILAGAYGEPSPFVVYSNILYSYIVGLFYRIPGNHFNWMVIFHYGMT